MRRWWNTRRFYWDDSRRSFQLSLKNGTKVIALLVAISAFAGITQINLTTQVQGVLPGANGGTNSAFFQVSGPTSLRTFTFPDVNSTILTSNTPVTVAQGGTGLATLTAHGVLLGAGTSNVVFGSPGASGQCFMSNGATSDPTFQTCPATPTFVDTETPSGAVDGTNVTYTLANTPNPSTSLACFKNGNLLEAGAGNDFTLSTSTITVASGAKLSTGDKLRCSYRK